MFPVLLILRFPPTVTVVLGAVAKLVTLKTAGLPLIFKSVVIFNIPAPVPPETVQVPPDCVKLLPTAIVIVEAPVFILNIPAL